MAKGIQEIFTDMLELARVTSVYSSQKGRSGSTEGILATRGRCDS